MVMTREQKSHLNAEVCGWPVKRKYMATNMRYARKKRKEMKTLQPVYSSLVQLMVNTLGSLIRFSN